MAPGDRAAITMKNLPGVSGGSLRHMACGVLRAARQCQTPSEGDGFSSSRMPERAVVSPLPTSWGTVSPLVDEIECLESVMEVDTPEYRAIQSPGARPPSNPGSRMTWPGSSIRAARRAGRRAPCSPHRNLHSMSLSYFAGRRPRSPKTIASCTLRPCPHGSGPCTRYHTSTRARNNIVPESGGFRAPGDFPSDRGLPGPSPIFAAPTMVTRLIQSEALRGADTTNLKTVAYGGGPDVPRRP